MTLTPEDERRLSPTLAALAGPARPGDVLNRVLHQDVAEVLPLLPAGFADLVVLDPPYNLAKTFNGRSFQKRSVEDYTEWMESWFVPLVAILKPTASVYVCGDWLTSASVFQVLHKHLTVRNRITWEREKGRGARTNWKNCSEDIWFATVSEDYCFNPGAVMLKRRVMAPYCVNGQPKDWSAEADGNFRLTHPSNFWSDITVPFWSMPENTDHPTQKPEKLLARLILASSRPGDVVVDPFLGSGTTAVVAKKLGRHFVGCEIDRTYCLLAVKRLEMGSADKSIQGYSDGVFWERNTLAEQLRAHGSPNNRAQGPSDEQGLLLSLA